MSELASRSAARAPSVLLVDDDPTVVEVVTRYLERDGFHVVAAGDGETALVRAGEAWPDLVVLDLMLPGMSGLELLRRLRLERRTPVVILTARSSESDRVGGLDLGADDYLAKPFSPRELVARVRSVLRRAARREAPDPPDAPLVFGDLRIERRARSVRVGGREVDLTAREFDLLAFLADHPDTAFDRATLLERVWGWSYGDASTVTVHVRRLREKLEEDPANPSHLLTVWGVGYRFAA